MLKAALAAGIWSSVGAQRCFPGAARHEAKRNDALQTRDRYTRRARSDPGSAVHRYASLRAALHPGNQIVPGLDLFGRRHKPLSSLTLIRFSAYRLASYSGVGAKRKGTTARPRTEDGAVGENLFVTHHETAATNFRDPGSGCDAVCCPEGGGGRQARRPDHRQFRISAWIGACQSGERRASHGGHVPKGGFRRRHSGVRRWDVAVQARDPGVRKCDGRFRYLGRVLFGLWHRYRWHQLFDPRRRKTRK